MTSEEFWNVIDTIDKGKLKTGHEGALEPLVDALTKMEDSEIRSFEDLLTKALHDLDGRSHWFCSGLNILSGDAFLYARAFVVARGKKAFDRVLRWPVLMPKGVNSWCESLLYCASTAWKRKHPKLEWDYYPDLSYETGSNAERW